MKILIKSKVETVSLDRVKSAHFECEPATGTITQRTTVSLDRVKPAHFECEPATGTITQRTTPSKRHQRSNRTSVKPTTTKSKATKHGTNLATTPQPKAISVKLPNQFKPYVAPHSRTLAVSRANGSDGGLRTYSCVPLHLRGKTPPTSDTRKQSNGKDDSTIADRDKVRAEVPARTTKVGRTIQTPARLVQMVYAVVAPNDIYGEANRKYRSNNSYNL